MKIPATLYLTDTSRNNFLRATTDKERLEACTIYASDMDMSSYWTKVGTCEVKVTWYPELSIRKDEVKRVDDQIKKIELEAVKQISRLQDYRATLLSLTYSPDES